MVCNRLVGSFYYYWFAAKYSYSIYKTAVDYCIIFECCRLCFLVAIGFEWLEANALAMTLSTEHRMRAHKWPVCVCVSVD